MPDPLSQPDTAIAEPQAPPVKRRPADYYDINRPQPEDEIEGQWTRIQLVRMDRDFRRRAAEVVVQEHAERQRRARCGAARTALIEGLRRRA